MEYNTQKKKLLLPEYGRNIQKMVDYLLTIEDREERTRAAKTVIDVMGNLYPHLRDVPDFRHKLWDTLYSFGFFWYLLVSIHAPVWVRRPDEYGLSIKHATKVLRQPDARTGCGQA